MLLDALVQARATQRGGIEGARESRAREERARERDRRDQDLHSAMVADPHLCGGGEGDAVVDRFVIPLGERHLRRVIDEYVRHCHLERDHRGLGNRLIDPEPANDNGEVVRRTRLGGLLT